jgi:hypothetical protein
MFFIVPPLEGMFFDNLPEVEDFLLTEAIVVPIIGT